LVAFGLTQEIILRIATYQYQGRRHLGLVADDGQTLHPLALDPTRARRGVLPLIEDHAAGGAWPEPTGETLALADVRLEAPLPLPRRNLFCVGRNYHAHAKELSGSVFRNNAANPQEWPIVFTKVPECVIGPADAVRLPGDAISA
jgi:2-keto-4-pentenoate hydratase/2-oxohepta-3-ene-1,7-dioic acid hydratase in catechol pathway